MNQWMVLISVMVISASQASGHRLNQATSLTPTVALTTTLCDIDRFKACVGAGANAVYCRETTCCNNVEGTCVKDCLAGRTGGFKCFTQCCACLAEATNVQSFVCDERCKSACAAEPGANPIACRDRCCCQGTCLESCLESNTPEACYDECAEECIAPTATTEE
ncbi:unnamed protein product [Cyprideis torosa]|uniref:Uncharacterized protein n=1 Tax=Cyprideis torosa TaxID=163714 RepID=A0A7R8ZU92_9CRUS|nr:unnamed protein product [Cyprideis torosa]CAG0900038.1 unnamed protein product [Cyprideis torosa]